MKYGFRIAALCFLFLLSCNITTAQRAPSPQELTRFYQDQLRSQSEDNRIDAITGLAQLGSDAPEAVPALIKLSKVEPNNFNRLLCLWALTEIGTYEAYEWSQSQALKEKPKLREGSFKEVSARTVLLSSIDQGENIFRLNKMLRTFFDKAKNGDTTEKLIAHWTLFELSTSVTINTAERAIQPVAEKLSPSQPNYVSHLRYIRLLGSYAENFFTDKLKALINDRDFSSDNSTKRAQTAYTLARISYPNEAEAVGKVINQISEQLKQQSTKRAALKNAAVLGPFICGSKIMEQLREISQDEGDQPEQQLAKQLVNNCTE